MNTLVSLLLVSLTQGFVMGTNITRETGLPGTKINNLITTLPPGIKIGWIPVNSDKEAVLGYKVRLWQEEGQKFYDVETEDEKEVVVQSNKMDSPIKSQSEAYEYTLSGADRSELIVYSLQLDTPYWVEVRTYGANGDAPPSPHVGFEIL